MASNDVNDIKTMKLAERVFILNDRQIGLLSRLHYMKSILNNSDFRPAFLPGGDKIFDIGWKTLLKKFPNPDIKPGHNSVQPFIAHQKDILPCLSTFYFDFVDVITVSDHISELLPSLSAAYIQLDVTINPDLTKLYLELLSNHFAMRIFITRIVDLKAILVLFNFLYDQSNGKSEQHYPRMCERFTESLENTLKSLHSEIHPHTAMLSSALASLADFFTHRTVRAKNWADGNFLDILNDPQSMTHAVLSDQLTCELIPYESMERWILFGYLMIFPELEKDDVFNRFRSALKNTYVVVLFRDEVVLIHSLVQTMLESQWNTKIGNKRIAEVKETLSTACSQAIDVHSDRRTYLRLALKQLYLVIADEPGLLGPKAFWVFWGLSYATDEINWLLRHASKPPNKKYSVGSSSAKQGTNIYDDMIGHHLPELLFYVDELRNLIIRYTPVIQKFHVKLLSAYDAPGLSEMLREVLPRLKGMEVDILNSILVKLSNVADESGKNESQNQFYDFSSCRLDWLRLQGYLTCRKSPINLRDHKRFVEHVNSTMFHTKLVDYLDELLKQTGNLSLFYFYQQQFKDLSNDCRMLPSQMRFSIVFSSICGQFTQACHPMCPEEKQTIGRKAVNLSHQLLQQLAEHICACILIRIDEYGVLADQLDPTNAISMLVEDINIKKKKRSKFKKENGGVEAEVKKVGPLKINSNLNDNSKSVLPGSESYRRNREQQTTYDKTLYALSQLCASLNHYKDFVVFDQVMNPREVLQNELQSKLIDILGKYTMLV